MSTTTRVHDPKKQGVANHFRPDIQGLRAVAVLVVLFYHGEISFFSGGYVGVDVFFVISGYLITSHLIRTGTKTGRIDLLDFYARRARRILPAATVVLLFTAFATVTLLPITRWENISIAIVASSFYLANWFFARNTDYLNSFSAPSPLQHYWTLSVEEQFYIIWPLSLVILLFFMRLQSSKRGGSFDSINPQRIQKYVGFAAILITFFSLSFSIYFSNISPSLAYFVTPTRLWELGIGAILAAFAGNLGRISNRLGHMIGIVGLVAILASSIFYDSATVFPGYAALLPTLGTAGVIIGGMAGRAESGAGAILRLPLMRWIGDLSYSLYLWHWPLIVIATYLLGQPLAPLQGLMIIIISFFPAWLSFHYVENPLRDWSVVKENAGNALKMGVALMTISTVAGIGVYVLLERSIKEVEPPIFTSYSFSSESSGLNSQPSPRLLGAEALASNSAAGAVVDEVSSFYPREVDALLDMPEYYSLGCENRAPSDPEGLCAFGDLDSDYVIALVGDSHAGQWAPALEPIALDQGWRLEIITKSACPLISTAKKGRSKFDSSCYEWNQEVMDHLTGPDSPDHVIVSSYVYSPFNVDDPRVHVGSIAQGYEMAWQRLTASGVPVTVLLDTPRPNIDIPECVAGNRYSLKECSLTLDEVMNNGAADQREAAEKSDVPVIDLTEYFCPDRQCPPIIGEVLVYRDGNHITATYSRSMATTLERELRQKTNLAFDESSL